MKIHPLTKYVLETIKMEKDKWYLVRGVVRLNEDGTDTVANVYINDDSSCPSISFGIWKDDK